MQNCTRGAVRSKQATAAIAIVMDFAMRHGDDSPDTHNDAARVLADLRNNGDVTIDVDRSYKYRCSFVVSCILDPTPRLPRVLVALSQFCVRCKT